MSSHDDRARLELHVEAGAARRAEPSDARTARSAASGPFRIALIGDFSARANRGLVERGKQIATRRPLRIDRDSVDAAIARLAPRLDLRLPDNGDRVEITFSSIDDFHPDALYARLPLFRELRDAGARAIASAVAVRAERTRSTPATSANLLDAILGDALPPPGGAALANAPARPSLSARSDTGISDFVERVLTPHLIPGADPTETELETRVDAAVTAVLRSILHHADFQRLEAAWRGIEFLVRRLDTDGALQLHLIDISPEELAADLEGGASHDSGFYQLVVEASAGPPEVATWALLVGLFSLGEGDQDITLLHRLGDVGRDAGAPFVAGAAARLAGTSSIAAHPDPDEWPDAVPQGWNALRASTAAPYLGLVLPRLLLRVPYGKKSDPCDRVVFEEMEPDRPATHEHYLWGAGSLSVGLLLGDAFTDAEGWNLRPGREIGGLPLHVYSDAGESIATPCAEALLTTRAAEQLLDRGFIPLLSVRDSDSVIVPRLQSIAEPARRLAGTWTHRDDVGN